MIGSDTSGKGGGARPAAILICALLLRGPAAAESSHQITLPSLDGGDFSLTEETRAGELVLFDFWATWCKPCIKSMPKVQKIARDYEGRGLKVFTVSVDSPRNRAKIRPFMKRHQLDLPVLLDDTYELMRQLHFTGVPATAILSQSEVLYRGMGYGAGSEQMLRRKIDELLKANGPKKGKEK